MSEYKAVRLGKTGKLVHSLRVVYEGEDAPNDWIEGRTFCGVSVSNYIDPVDTFLKSAKVTCVKCLYRKKRAKK